MKAAWEGLGQRWADRNAKCNALDKEHGGSKAVDAKIADTAEKLEAEQKQLRHTNGRAAVVNEAVEFLDNVGDEEPPCPICETVVPGLTDRLKENMGDHARGPGRAHRSPDQSHQGSAQGVARRRRPVPRAQRRR